MDNKDGNKDGNKDEKKDNKGPAGMKPFKDIAIWLVIGLILMALFNNNTKNSAGTPSKQLDYSEFIEQVESGKISQVTLKGRNNATGLAADGTRFSTYVPTGDIWFYSDLIKKKVKFKAEPDDEPSFLTQIFISWFPMLLLIGVWIWFMRSQGGMGGKGGNPFTFGKSRAKISEGNENKVTFADVAGCDEAKHEVEEIVDFLREPTKFQKLGGKIPKGVLLVGAPGTGKTLLARAIAGEAKVPFFAISGSDFVEMFVGVGAARVRDMFEQAKKNAPCIVFIDEIDAVGRHRGAGIGGGNDEREQTLNQLLVEMDGFEGAAGIIIIGATNRPDVLDPALTRPGRLDRQVVVPLPDLRGREQILKVHTRKVPVSGSLELKTIARGTPGFSGADLANLVNEAALFAARRSKKFVEGDDFESAKDKIIMGSERKSAIIPEKERRVTAYHEAGHAIVALAIPGCDPVHKVTIIPRGRALGVTMQLPEEDRYSHSKQDLLNRMAVLYGGRAAEEMFIGESTTGASSDFERATAIARSMVTRWGMSKDMGVMVYGEPDEEIFLGRSVTQHKNVAEGTQLQIDSEVRGVVEGQYTRALSILEKEKAKVEAMAQALLDLETIDAEQIMQIWQGKIIRGYGEQKATADERRKKLADEAASSGTPPPPAAPGPDVKPALARNGLSGTDAPGT